MMSLLRVTRIRSNLCLMATFSFPIFPSHRLTLSCESDNSMNFIPNLHHLRKLPLGKILYNTSKSTMLKRELPSELPNGPHKRSRLSNAFSPIKIATKEAAAAVDTNTPLSQLTELMSRNDKKSVEGKSVVFWMRMSDLRSEV